jgi:hypothetical protein
MFSLAFTVGLVTATPTLDPYTVNCSQYSSPVTRQGCSPAVGRWLPHLVDEFAWVGKSDWTRVRDTFVYPSLRQARFSFGPADGTYFTYGEAGPPRGHVVYDRAHRIAFYNVSCCAWGRAVLASSVGPPPKPIAERDLSGVHTKAGVRLGQTPADVMQIYGRSTLHDLNGRPGYRVLAYTTLSRTQSTGNGSPCNGGHRAPQWQTFVFQNDRLVFIALAGGC